MKKNRRSQLFLIIAVSALTIYNILPTLFYYLRPLHAPITQSQAMDLAQGIEKRIERLDQETTAWIRSYCELLALKPTHLQIDPQNPEWITVSFAKSSEAARLRAHLPRAGSLIPFSPAQLGIASQEGSTKQVIVRRRVANHLKNSSEIFAYVQKSDGSYRDLISDRVGKMGLLLGGSTEQANALAQVEQGNQAYVSFLASYVLSVGELFAENPSIAARYAASLTQGPFANRTAAVQKLMTAFDALRDALKQHREQEKDPEQAELFAKQEELLIKARTYLKKWETHFASGKDAFTETQLKILLQHQDLISLGSHHPLFSSIQMDLSREKLILTIHPDVDLYRKSSHKKEGIEQLLIGELAKITQDCNETIKEHGSEFHVSLHRLCDASGFLVLNLEKLAKNRAEETLNLLKSRWHPQHPDLRNLPIVSYDTYQELPPEKRALALVLCNPLIHPAQDLQEHSLYFIAKGIDRLQKTYADAPDSPLAHTLANDLRLLNEELHQIGFYGYPVRPNAPAFLHMGEFVFEKPYLFSQIIQATREDFLIQGTKKYAVLELSDLEQRLLVENRIDSAIHEDLIKWRDEYRSAQVNLQSTAHFDVPKPTQSPFLSNLFLTARKFLRGDEKKALRWGLDLSGGKTVQIELRDANQKLVTSDIDLKQGINELYSRVNKIGLSEVSIRQVGHQIALDFPGSQALSASELIQGSTMSFHIVNEKFALRNSALGDNVNRFLQEVWNEALVKGKKDPEQIHEIAYKRLHGEKSHAAQSLWDSGLRLYAPSEKSTSYQLDETLSKIAVFQGDNFSDWHEQSHPLLIVFNNHTLEGSNLENVHSAYDPEHGNYLSFEVAKTQVSQDPSSPNARDSLHAWTSRFSKEKILGTPYEAPTSGKGWRMAVLLNDRVISAPTLDGNLRDRGMIYGSFSQRQVQKLAADLKAGSLTFTPRILSEKNVSPELGQTDRTQGIVATLIALCFVIGSMILYYRFSGLIASLAVIFNLLILWATLQNLGATLTLAGIAGIILTVGMAVDANVLVFERIKEEFALNKSIGAAISEGYRKAFSAIVDSNVTTIIAALILLNFDAGPIKSFAINLIIGIASSMFTALFVTKVYFEGWAAKPKNKVLKMANWIQSTQYDFLKKARLAFLGALGIILVGGFFIFSRSNTIFGMDFTGGFALNLELTPNESTNYKSQVEEALLKGGAHRRDFQIQVLSPANHVRILLGIGMEQEGRPFFQLPLEHASQTSLHPFQKNPRIDWVVKTLGAAHLQPLDSSLSTLHTNWTSMSGQMSDSMKNHALIGLLIALACIFIYLSFRFEYEFAAAALLCLFHDILITMGLIGIFHAIGIPVQIDLNTIAALMTIIGYSLNDTIIIFDRVREEMEKNPHKNLKGLVNRALNSTLSRTTITSGTTLLVLIALVAFGGASIFSFALVMTVGVFFGTLSSWFIASPLMLFFHRRQKISTV